MDRVAEGEYLRNMQDARVGDDADRTLGGSLLLSDSVTGRETLLGAILQSDSRAGCARPPKMPRRERHRTLGLRRLRLHRTAGTEIESVRQAVSRFAPERRCLQRLYHHNFERREQDVALYISSTWEFSLKLWQSRSQLIQILRYFP